MNTKLISKITLIAAFMTTSLIGCGSSSDDDSDDGDKTSKFSSTNDLASFSGNKSSATATQNNADTLARAASEGVLQASKNIDLPVGIQAESTPLNNALNKLVLEKINQQTIPLGFKEVEKGSCGGKWTLSYDDDFTGSGTYNFSSKFEDYCVGTVGSYYYIINGTMSGATTVSSNQTTQKTVITILPNTVFQEKSILLATQQILNALMITMAKKFPALPPTISLA